MSDHTSDTQNGVGSDAGEPSMEDILASIRRIIAEDDNTGDASIDTNVLLSDPDPSTNMEAEVEDILVLDDATASDDILDLSDVISSEGELEIPQPAEEFNPVSNVVSDLEDKLTGDTASSDAEASFDAMSAEETSSVDDIDLILSDMDLVVSSDEVAAEDGDEIDLLKEDILSVIEEDISGTVELDPSMDIAPDVISADEEVPDESIIEDLEIEELALDDEPEALVSGASESDLDLVKSLMADLTDSSFLDEGAVAENVDLVDEIDDEPEILSTDDILDEIEADLADEDVMDAADDVAELESENEQDQILNDILDMTLESQEQQNSADALDLTVEEPLTSEDQDDDNLLLQIAAAAESDAESPDYDANLESSEDFNLMDELQIPDPDEGVQEEDILEELQEDLDLDDDVVEPLETLFVEEDEADTADLEIETPQETEDMARVRKDTILDEVTETAAAGAFASLNQVVEEKAVFTESGPRIGDLVQEALRPMLKEWLDENLKSIVERAVAKEVKRISSGK